MIIVYLAFIAAALYWVSKTLMPEMIRPKAFGFPQSSGPDKRVELLETLLIEKNKDIKFLQTEIRALDVQVRSFNKVKAILDGEIQRLREQNRIFRSELGLPTVQLKENSIK